MLFFHPLIFSQLKLILKAAHNRKRSTRSIAYLLVIFGVFGCGGTGQDNGQAATESQILSGLAIDGYLARSMVFIDYDNNRTRDPWEPYAFTDNDGYFSVNQKTNTNYCSPTAAEHNELFCLRTNRNISDAVVRIDGGYDVMTGEPFYGQLSRRLPSSPLNNDHSIVISPITSLLADVRSTSARNAIFTTLGLREDDLNEDYLDNNGSATAGDLLNTALKLHKAISLISQAAGRSYQELGSQTGAMNDASAMVYKHLADQLSGGGQSLQSIFTNPTSIAQIIAGIELEILEYYDRWEISNTQSVAINPGPLTAEITSLSQLIDAVIQSGSIDDMHSVTGAIKLVEAMTIKAVSDPLNRAALHDSIRFLRDPQNQTFRNDLIAALAEANSDISAVAQLDLTNPVLNSANAIREAGQLPPNATPFRQLVGQQLRVSDMDLGTAPNHLRDSEVEFYFLGNQGDTHGSFTACVKYIKDADSTGKLGDANTRGELVKGHWSLLGANQNNEASYSLLLTIEFLGTRYQAILKPASGAIFNGEEMQGIRFDYGNELRTWHTRNGLEAVQALPVTASDCANRLPSRIGI